MLEVFKRLWIGWNDQVVRNILRAQNFVLMSIVFIFGLAPVALALKAMRRPMLDRGSAPPGTQSYWVERDGKPMTMEQAARQF
jgi:hypothetical protein